MNRRFTQVLFYACLAASAGHFLACVWLATQGVRSWPAVAMGAFFLVLALVHHRRLR